MAYEYDPTDLTAIQESTPSYTGGSETDVIFQYGYLPPEAAGMAWCDDAISSSVRDQHYAKFNTSSPSYALACHETGHTVGLTHGADALSVAVRLYVGFGLHLYRQSELSR